MACFAAFFREHVAINLSLSCIEEIFVPAVESHIESSDLRIDPPENFKAFQNKLVVSSPIFSDLAKPDHSIELSKLANLKRLHY